MLVRFLACLVLLGSTCDASAVRFARQPSVSPDGKTLVFVNEGDIWKVGTRGGKARRLTHHLGQDSQPAFSPDGSQIAFISDREGSDQVFVMSADGGVPKQITFHTEGHELEGWFPDGNSVLVTARRDHHWRHADRLFRINVTRREAEQLQFDAYGEEGAVSPDGKQILFMREGERWWRKGYQGARSAQIWRYDIPSKKFQQILNMDTGCRSPQWKADGGGFYYCGSQGSKNGARHLWAYDFKSKKSTQLTHFEDDLVISPTVSADGSTIVFRHQFDLYRLRPGKDKRPKKIAIEQDEDSSDAPLIRRSLSKANELGFTKDGLEVAFSAGGDIWVMDTSLREPRQVTNSAEWDSEPIFGPKGDAIYYIGVVDGQPDIWKAERADTSKYWWQNTEFKRTRITNDAATEFDLNLSKNDKELSVVKNRGELWLLSLDGKKSRKLLDGFEAPSYDFSPDGDWIVYAQSDDDFNKEIWIKPTDGSREPVNISRHPDNEYSPRWSPDGKLIAFTGRRADQEIDIYYVWLQKQDEEVTSRDRKLQRAIDAFKKARKSGAVKTPAPKVVPKAAPMPKTPADPKVKPKTAAPPKTTSPKPSGSKTKIDFDGIHHRIHRIKTDNASESGLIWSHDSKKLAFRSSINGKSGTYYVTIPDSLTPRLLTTTTGSFGRWTKSPDRILWLANGVPGSVSSSGSTSSYSFRVYQKMATVERHKAAFDACWRAMRDWWYDDNYGNHNWDAVRRKYLDAAAHATDIAALQETVHLMLGELNGSHLGFSTRSSSRLTPSSTWRPVTAHLGLRFEHGYKGPGLKVRDVVPRGPTMRTKSTVKPGEIVLAIDGTAVDPAYDLTQILNGRADRDVTLSVQSADNKKRTVVIRPTTFGVARVALYTKWQRDNRKMVDKLSKDTLGYLHIQGMNWPSFLQFERELYDVGYGKDGLIIDVRDNGGGFTTDHLLTALTQPRHAITVPRGGGKGYPHDRMVYATWHKPIIVLCNQNSYSNAEIFSHAIKNLGRGKLVGVPTAGGVISTGSVGIMDMGVLRRPFRGWFVAQTGEDMELNGAVPDVTVWPLPGEVPAGKDRQLDKAAELLMQDVKAWKAKPRPSLKKATAR